MAKYSLRLYPVSVCLNFCVLQSSLSLDLFKQFFSAKVIMLRLNDANLNRFLYCSIEMNSNQFFLHTTIHFFSILLTRVDRPPVRLHAPRQKTLHARALCSDEAVFLACDGAVTFVN